MDVVNGEVQLDPVEQVVNRLHDRVVGKGLEPGRAARAIRNELAVRAIAVDLSEEFWSWLGS